MVSKRIALIVMAVACVCFIGLITLLVKQHNDPEIQLANQLGTLQTQVNDHNNNVENALGDMGYFQDERTDMCYAFLPLYSAYALAEVECTQKVLVLIKDQSTLSGMVESKEQ